jgi:hypothetical protein
MATTTNYGWTTPDDTALVKDGAAAIRTLGSSVDTTTKNLNPETTLGDLAYRSSTANVKTRLALGTAGQILAVNSGATAPEWVAAPSSGGMTLISTTTLTGASVTLSSIPQTYKNLQLVVRNYKPADDGPELTARFNGDSGTRYRTLSVNQSTNAEFLSTSMTFSEQNDNSVATDLVIIDIYDYTNAVTWKTAAGHAFNNNPTTSTNFNYGGFNFFYNQIDAITSIRLAPSAGNFTSGTALLYGVS